jgi:hypothetical protein
MDLEINIALILIACTGIAAYLISTILIYEFHKKRNDKTPSFLLVNLNIFKYVNRYRIVTKAEKRRTGPLFYFWIISINVSLICVLFLFLINVVIMKGA